MKTLFLDDEQCELLREILDFVPLTPRYIGFVADMLQRIPESAAVPPSADSASAHSTVPSAAGGFTLTALTPRGAAAMTALNVALERVLRNTP